MCATESRVVTCDVQSIRVELMSAADLEAALPRLVELLREAVNGGASLGFLPPLGQEEARDYWQALLPELQAGSRLLLAAYSQDCVVSSGQLSLPSWSNGRHRAVLQKMFVSAAFRRQGIGRLLLAELQALARARGRSLLLIDARRGDAAERLYKGLGYREFGVIPGYSVGENGERYDNVCMYQEIAL
jgi:acetyltransferase